MLRPAPFETLAHHARAGGLTPRDGRQDNPTHSRERAGSLLEIAEALPA
jgi:hypothetical protein